MDQCTQRPIDRRRFLRRGALSAAVAALGMGGATRLMPAAAQQATPAALPSDGNPPGVTPERVAAAVAQLDRLIEQTLTETGIPGLAVAVVSGGETPYMKGFGTREAGRDLPVDAGTVFQLASVSKPISSTIVAAVVGDGDVTWDSRLTDHLPFFQMSDSWVTAQVTIRDMFCHRSGLPDHAGDPLEDLGFDRDEILYRLRFIEPGSSFRSTYDYTNYGITAAAVAAATAAGADWEELAERRLFQPLGMERSSYRFADFIADPNHAVGHMKVDGVWTAKEQRQPDPQAPAGGVSSNLHDMVRWMRLQLGAGAFAGEEIVAAAALNETHIPQIALRKPANPNTDRTSFYGLGWNVGYTDAGAVRLNHSGAFNLGAGTVVQLLPGSGLGIVVLTNAQPVGAAETLAFEFCDLAEFGAIRQDYRTLFAQAFAAMMAPDDGTEVDYLAPPASATPALPPAAYSGTFTNDLYGDIVVAEAVDGLALRIGPDLTSYPLTHYDHDIFWYQPPGENAFGPSGVTFTIGVDDRARRVVIENLDLTHQGTFTRKRDDAAGG